MFVVAFHEAIGDAIALSVATPKHLQTLGLVQKSIDDTAHDINFLFSLSLDKVSLLTERIFSLSMYFIAVVKLIKERPREDVRYTVLIKYFLTN